MQDCFREHPDVYGEELADDEEGAEAPENAVGEQQAVLKQQPEERPSAGQLAEDRKPAEEQSEDFLPPGRGLYEGKAILAEREAAKQSRVEAEPKDAPAPRQSATPASSDAQSGESSK
jgi:intermembrane space import and assembly protein 40